MSGRRKTFDCVEQKRKAQRRIYRRIRGLSHAEEIAYFDRAVRSGPLADFWRRLSERAETQRDGKGQRRAGG